MERPSLDPYLQHAGNERSFIIDHLPERSAWTVQNALVLGLFDLAMDHHWVILKLLDEPGREGSALALVRPLVESCYRVHWVTTLDGDAQQNLWNGKKDFLPLKNTVDQVVKHYKATAFESAFAKILESTPVLNDLTHGGIQQIRSRFQGMSMAPNYPFRMLVDALRVTTGLVAFTAVAYTLCIEGVTAEGRSKNALALGKRLETVMTGFQLPK